MSCIRPATPGFLVTLVATALLAVVSFCVPYFKSVYFLKADISVGGVNGSITFGTLGYCLTLPTNGTTCSKPTVGYELDINSLVGNTLPVEIPNVVVKWITYALVLHIVALGLAAGSAVFGLLAHIREMSMACCSTCVSGFAAAVAMLAFIFDIALFFAAKSRINAVGTATMGNAIWLTLAAWLLLFFSGCFYTLGRCCVSKRPRGGGRSSRRDHDRESGIKWADESGRSGRYEPSIKKPDYTEQLRLDAVKAEADRKARQKEAGLPVLGSETQPLTGHIEGNHVYLDDPNKSKEELSSAPSSLSSRPSQNGPRYNAGGYVQGAPGSRAVDEYYNPTTPATPHIANTYPPQRQGSSHSYAAAAYPPSPNPPQRQPSAFSADGAAGTGYYGAYQTTSPPPMPSQVLAVPSQTAYNDPYTQYGHTAGGSSYHTAYPSGQDGGYAQYDPYSPQPQQAYGQPSFIAQDGGYGSSTPPMPQAHYSPYSGAVGIATSTPPAQSNSGYYGQSQPQKQYTLSGDGYGENTVPALQTSDPYYQMTTANEGYASSGHVSPVGGPRPQPGSQPRETQTVPDEAPPGYEQGNSGIVGQWGKQ